MGRQQKLISGFNSEIEQLNQRLDERYLALVLELKKRFAKFTSILELAFNVDVNVAFYGSVILADHVGVPNEKVLRTKRDIDRYFLN